MVISQDGQPLAAPKLLDMAAEDLHWQAKIDAGKCHASEVEWLEISEDTELGAAALDLPAIYQRYLDSVGVAVYWQSLRGKRLR